MCSPNSYFGIATETICQGVFVAVKGIAGDKEAPPAKQGQIKKTGVVGSTTEKSSDPLPVTDLQVSIAEKEITGKK